MATLLVAEHINTVLKDATNKALTAARALGGEVHVLMAGKGCRPAAEAAAKLDGVANGVSNRRLVSADGNGVAFRWKDYRIDGPGRWKTMTLSPTSSSGGS